MVSEPALHPASVAVAGGRPSRVSGAPLNAPVDLSTVTHGGGAAPPAYAREGTPTWAAFEEVVGALEGGHACAFASGIAAVDAVVAQVPVGGTVVAPYDAYSGARELLADLESRGRIDHVRWVEVADTDAALAAAEGADLLWIESPTNPLMSVADVAALCAGARRLGVRSAVDNTFATPLRQRPLELGADVVVHSATKLLSGHSDVLLGATVAADRAVAETLEAHRRRHGAVPGPMETWLGLRGIRTLPVRLDRAEATAQTLAERLARHPAVARVRYPGLADDPGYTRAQDALDGPGTMLAIELAGGTAAADRLCAGVRLAVHATSLGGVETSLERRAHQPGEGHVPPGLVRISIGCEDPDDLWSDLARALEGP